MNLSGNPIDYLTAFLGGALVSWTPCVYPLIPVSAGYIGITSAKSKRRAVFLSLLYVTGLALTYSALGVIASLTGTIFGRLSSHPVTYLAAGAAVIFFGLSMSGVFNPVFPSLIKPPAVKRKDYPGAFLLGLVSGLVVSPCLTPVVGAILVYLAAKQNVLYGAALLFSFAYGMGLVLILAGIFSSVLVSLPKSGRWMLYVKRICAALLLAMGAYFVITGIRRF